MAEVLEARALPEGLDVAVPGPELARLLASVDRSRLDGPDVVALLKARNRQLAYEQGELLADLVEVAHCPDVGTVRSEQPLEFVEFEVACALTWTNFAAGKQLYIAVDLLGRLPAVHAALLAGLIDFPKAWMFAEVTRPLDDVEEVRRIADLVLPEAPRLTTSEIARKLRKLIASVDPEAAKRRAAKSKEGRRGGSDPPNQGNPHFHPVGAASADD